jgi:DEAD/DEAH box helicase domain-containing protein
VALPDALDQFFLDHPEQFLERPCERLVVDPVNDPVSRAHLICAAAEMPLGKADQSYLERHRGRVDSLLRGGHLLEEEESGELYSLRRKPQRGVNLRGTGASYVILAGQTVIGTVDGVRALHECHPGAIYLHAGRQYLVHEMEREERRVTAEAVEVDYFTSPLTEKETEVLEVLQERTDGPLTAWLGRLKVTERVVGYERKRIHGQETIDQHPLDFPPVEFETVGLWWAAPRAVEETLRKEGEHFMGSLHASEHAAISLFPLLALCDRNDIGGISYSIHPQVGCGAVFVYDGHPGGVGIAAKGFEDLPDLLGRVRLLIEGCPCEDGCPSCIQSPKCGNGNRPLHKAGAARALRLLLGLEEAAEAWGTEPIAIRFDVGTEEATPSLEPGVETPGWQSFALRATPEGRDSSSLGVQPQVSGTGLALWAPLPDAHLLPDVFPLDETDEIDGPAPAPVAASPSAVARPAPPVRAPGPRPRTAHTVLFDIETLRSAADVGGWGNAHRMGVAVGVVCHLEEGRFEVYPESGVRGLCDDLRGADLVIGFNIKRFDYQVLAGYTGEDYGRLVPTLDLLDEVTARLGFRVGMGHLAQETLGLGKSADGLQSLEWVKQGRLDLVEEYCRRDVEILRDLYLHGRREGFLSYRDPKRDLRLKLRVDW